jgi:hypothetical protein
MFLTVMGATSTSAPKAAQSRTIAAPYHMEGKRAISRRVKTGRLNPDLEHS